MDLHYPYFLVPFPNINVYAMFLYESYLYHDLILSLNFRSEVFNSTQFNNWVYEGKAPAQPESLQLYKKLLNLGIKAVFLTGRSEAQRNITAANLKKVGYHTWEKLILK